MNIEINKLEKEIKDNKEKFLSSSNQEISHKCLKLLFRKLKIF